MTSANAVEPLGICDPLDRDALLDVLEEIAVHEARFTERFYEIFLASSPKVAEKFSTTDFRKQKRALRASFHAMLSAVYDGESGPETVAALQLFQEASDLEVTGEADAATQLKLGELHGS